METTFQKRFVACHTIQTTLQNPSLILQTLQLLLLNIQPIKTPTHHNEPTPNSSCLLLLLRRRHPPGSLHLIGPGLHPNPGPKAPRHQFPIPKTLSGRHHVGLIRPALHRRLPPRPDPVSVSDAGVAETLIFDPDLPENVTIGGLAIDTVNNRVLAAVHSLSPLPKFDALVAYDLRTRRRVFLSLLPSSSTGGGEPRPIPNDVAVDFKGNAYVTNSIGNYIWKVNDRGEASIFSESPTFTAHPVDRSLPNSFCGVNGIVYVSKGYLLVVQSNTGKMFKVREEDGAARLVLLNEDMPLADGIVVRGDGVVLVNSMKKVWVLKSQDSWGEGVVYDKIDLEEERHPTALTVGNDDRVYAVYGHVLEGFKGNSSREIFGIEEVRSEKENTEEGVWIFVLVGLGLAYFLFWRFQMRRLITNVDKKTSF